MSSSSSHSPCAACKFLRRKCTQECVFAPYFPPDQPQKFASVHRVYGASNVAKLLNELPVSHREETVASLTYEADARLRDPIYGCVGFISYLHTRLSQIQAETLAAKKELAAYIGPQAMMMMLQAYHPYPSPGPTALQIPPSLAIQAPSNPNPSLADHHMLVQRQQQQQLVQQHMQMYGGGGGGGFEQAGSVGPAAAVAFGGGFGSVGGVESGGYGSNQVVQVQQEQQVQPHQRAVSDAVVDYQIQAQFGLLGNAPPHDHQAHCKSDVGPQING